MDDGNVVNEGLSERDGLTDGNEVMEGASERDGSSDTDGTPDG